MKSQLSRLCLSVLCLLAPPCVSAAGEGAGLPAELTINVGGFLQTLHKDPMPRAVPAPGVSIRGDVRTRSVRGGPSPREWWEETRPTFPKVLAIVTTQQLATTSGKLVSYVQWRNAGGWQVIVATEAEWNKPTTRDGDDRQARIRAWLKDEYTKHNLGYVLLIGDPTPEGLTGIPMRRMQPLSVLLSMYPPDLADSLADVPSDHYYSDLESDWDCDGDGEFGEYPDDKGPGCADWGPEVIVGRIPVYGDVQDLDTILAATMAFEQAPDKSYRDRVMLAGSFGGFRGQPAVGGGTYEYDDDGAVFLNRIFLDLPTDRALTPVRLYEDEGVVTSVYPHEGALNNENVLEQWRAGASTVSWSGHGNQTGAYRTVWLQDADADENADLTEVDASAFIASWDRDQLTEAPPAFVHMMSCLNAYAEDSDNLATALLAHGAVGTAAASRSAVGDQPADWEPRPELGDATVSSYYFTLLLQRNVRVGEALAYTKWALPADGWSTYDADGIDELNAYGWLTKAEYNLYGDPTLSLERCASDAECEDGLPCNGQEHCSLGYCVHEAPVVCAPAGDLPICQTYQCDNATGSCAVIPVMNGTACDDHEWCTTGDQCLEGECVGASRECPEVTGYRAVCDGARQECTLEPERIEPPPKKRGCAALSSDTAVGPFSSLVAFLLFVRGLSRSRRREEANELH
jgi:hypothetical protein